jgi:hypothetical protein
MRRHLDVNRFSLIFSERHAVTGFADSKDDPMGEVVVVYFIEVMRQNRKIVALRPGQDGLPQF